MFETDKPKTNTPETEKPLTIIEGLSRVTFPEFGKRNHFGNLSPETEAETMAKLDEFLRQLNAQGAKIISVFEVQVDVGTRPGVSGRIIETRKVAIVQKVE